ncbi:MAG: hypothetical protein IH946_08135, partial [Bacteroidetes bacterium]|nr:hypothetical protein [Bacteroidota bacterium]
VIMSDDEDNVWIGTHGGGMIRYEGALFTHYTTQQGLGHNNVWSILQDYDENFWIGTYGGGITRISENGSTTFTTEDGLGSDIIFSTFLDSRGRIWIANKGEGVTIYEDGNFSNLSMEDGLSSNMNFAFCEDNDGNMWISSVAKGVDVYDGKSFRNIRLGEDPASNIVVDIHRDYFGNMVFATYNGLYFWKDDSLIHFDEEDGLPHKEVMSISEDKYKNLWIGTYGGGVAFFNGTDFTVIDKDDGLSSNNINLLIADFRKDIWVGTEKGVDRISVVYHDSRNIELVKIEHYGKEEGFVGIETNQNAAFKDNQGNIWFGTLHGATKYNPRYHFVDNNLPSIRITNIELFFEEVNWKEKNVDLMKWNHLPVNLELQASRNHVTFSFHGTSMKNQSDVMYRFMLEGSDRDWLPPTKERKATYANLPPGNYIFMVKACLRDCSEESEVAIYPFRIKSPFYTTWWFYTMLALITVSGLYILLKLRERRQIRNLLELERMVKERTTALQLETDKYEAINQQLHDSNLELEKLSIVAS